MSAEIILFSEAQLKLDARREHSNILHSTTRHLPIFQDKIDFLNHLETRNSAFMFPTTLSRYRKGINPVDAIYNTLQIALYNFDKSNPMHTWIIGLFKDNNWASLLQSALDKDCNSIKEMLSCNVEDEALKRTLSKFLHYKQIFSLMKDWEEH